VKRVDGPWEVGRLGAGCWYHVVLEGEIRSRVKEFQYGESDKRSSAREKE
jgi:hypothetical protein